MPARRYLVSVASMLIVAISFAGIAHADPVAAVVTAPAVVEVTSWAMMAVAALAGAVAALSAIGTALHFVAPRTKTTLDDRAAAVVDTMRADLAEVLAAVRAFVPGGTVVQELAPIPPAAPASPITINMHPPAAPSAPAPGTMTTTTVGPIAALLLFVALATNSGCAAATRADTLQTATLTVVAARGAMLDWEPTHELDLAKAGTPDQAAAALAAYRAKRATANKAFVAAVDAIVLAGGLNDQPSLDGVAKAIAAVLADYKALKGMP